MTAEIRGIEGPRLSTEALTTRLFAGRPALRRRILRKNEFLTREGDSCAYLFRIRVGGLIVLSEGADGSVSALDWIGPNGLCGLEEAVRLVPYGRSSRATTTSVAECLPLEDFHRAMRTDSYVAAGVATCLSERAYALANHAETLAINRLAERVRRILRALAERANVAGRPVALRLTQDDLAALAASSRQRVNPVLMMLRRAGVVELERGIIRVLMVSSL